MALWTLLLTLALSICVVHTQDVYLNSYSSEIWDGSCGSCPLSSPCSFDSSGTTTMSTACRIVLIAEGSSFPGYFTLAYTGPNPITLSTIGDIGATDIWTFQLPNAPLRVDSFMSNDFLCFSGSMKELSLKNTTLRTSGGNVVMGQIPRLTITNSSLSVSGSGNFQATAATITVSESSLLGGKWSFSNSGAAGASFSVSHSNLHNVVLIGAFANSVVEDSIVHLDDTGYMFPAAQTSAGSRVAIRRSHLDFPSGPLLQPVAIDSGFLSLEMTDVDGYLSKGISTLLRITNLTLVRVNLETSSGYLIQSGPFNTAYYLTVLDSSFNDSTSGSQSYINVAYSYSTNTKLHLQIRNIRFFIGSRPAWNLAPIIHMDSPYHLEDITTNPTAPLLITGAPIELSNSINANQWITLDTSRVVLASGFTTNVPVTIANPSNFFYKASDASVGLLVSRLDSTFWSLEWPEDLPLPAVNSTYPLAKSTEILPYNENHAEFNLTIGWDGTHTHFLFNEVACNSNCAADHLSNYVCVSRWRCECLSEWTGPFCDISTIPVAPVFEPIFVAPWAPDTEPTGSDTPNTVPTDDSSSTPSADFPVVAPSVLEDFPTGTSAALDMGVTLAILSILICLITF